MINYLTISPSGISADVDISEDATRVVWTGLDKAIHLTTCSQDGRAIVSDMIIGHGVYGRIKGEWVAWKREGTWDVGALHIPTNEYYAIAEEATGNNPIALGYGWLAFQTGPANAYTIKRITLEGTKPNWPTQGSPQGLAWVDSTGQVVKVDDIRLAVSGMLNPIISGDLIVGEGAGAGSYLALKRGWGSVKALWQGLDSQRPRCSSNYGLYAITAWGAQGIRLGVGNAASIDALPEVGSTFPVAPAIAPATFHYDLGFYKNVGKLGPGTCVYSDNTGTTTKLSDGSLIATNTGGVESTSWQSSSDETWTGLTVPFITEPPNDISATIAQSFASTMAGHPEPVGLTLQCDSRVDGNHNPRWSDAQVAELVYSYPALVAQYSNIRMVLLFARDREGGLVAHPSLVPFIEAWVESLI